ncbi:MAG: hypothetical protein COB66_09220 [Coxiella sp. (in: Bacteria)]|nr:MAG: hypothetical protein COB66_09220 [Coxiella sp. (in: g-proteobacteria)]
MTYSMWTGVSDVFGYFSVVSALAMLACFIIQTVDAIYHHELKAGCADTISLVMSSYVLFLVMAIMQRIIERHIPQALSRSL